MAGQHELSAATIADEQAIFRLAHLYARAVDRRDAETLAALFIEDGVIDRSGNAWRGRAALRGIPARLDGLYASTLHTVRNQTATVDGDTAEGETYSIACHLRRPENGKQVRIDWGIRYQDRFARENGAWLFAKRELIVDWVETTELPIAP
jgi:uncharacterized protein (TIGR02246 family)